MVQICDGPVPLQIRQKPSDERAAKGVSPETALSLPQMEQNQQRIRINQTDFGFPMPRFAIAFIFF